MIDHRKDLIQQEIVNALNKHRSGLVAAATGTGKTRAAILHIMENYDVESRICWFTPSIPLRDVDTPADFVRWGAGRFAKTIEFYCYHSAPKLENKNWDLIVMDEAHEITSLRYEFFTKNNFTNVICLTATPPVEAEKKHILYNLLGLKIIFKLKIDEAAKLGVVPNFEVNLIKVPLNNKKTIPVKTKKVSFMTSEEADYRYQCQMINQLRSQLKMRDDEEYDDFMIRRESEAYQKILKNLQWLGIKRKRSLAEYTLKPNLVKQFLMKRLDPAPGKYTLVFCGTKDQADLITNQVYYSGSSDEYLEAFRRQEIKHLAAIERLTAGVNLPANTGVMLAVSKKDRGFIQKLGRMLRKNEGQTNKLYVFVYQGTVEHDYALDILKGIDCVVKEHTITLK